MIDIGKAVIIFSLIHAYVFAILLFYNNRTSCRILGFYMINYFIQGFLFVNLYVFKIGFLHDLFYYFLSPLSLCSIPIIYLYVKYMSDENFRIRINSIVHFLPAILLLLVLIIVFVISPADQRSAFLMETDKHNDFSKTFFTVISASIVILFFQIFYYPIKMLILLLRHKKNLPELYSYREKITLNWLLVFVIVYFAYNLFDVIIFSLRFINVSETLYFSVVSLHIFFIGIFGVKQRDIYNKKKVKTNDVMTVPVYAEAQVISSENISDKRNEREASEIIKGEQMKVSRKNLPLSAEEIENIKKNIMALMTEKKIFLNPELSLEEMAEMLQLNKNYLSYILNDEFKMNFYNFINNFRIEEAKRMLLDKKYNHLSIEGIARSVGYSSRNVFYPVFKKIVGMTPLEFKKQQEQVKDN